MAFSRSVAMIVAASALAAGMVTGEGLAQQAASAGVAHPELWPTLPMKLKRNPKVEARVDAILKRMSVEDKVGQLIQVDIASITPKDLETYKLGSVLTAAIRRRTAMNSPLPRNG